MRLSVPSCSRLLAAIGLATALSLTSLSAVSATHDHEHAQLPAAAADAAQARQLATDHTQALMALQKQWANAQGAKKSRALEQLVAKAEERQAFLAELVTTNPDEVLRVAIPDEQQQGMPAEALEFVEQRLELEGELEVGYEDYEDGSHKLRQYLHTPFGERFELHIVGKQGGLKHGTSVRVDGLVLNTVDGDESSLLDGAIALGSSENLLALGDDGSSDGTVLAAPSGSFGEQKVLVLLVNFQDDPDNKPWTFEQVHDNVFNNVNNYYLEASEGRASLSGEVTGWFTLPINSTVCDRDGIASNANSAAAATGINLSDYTRLIYAFPTNSGCGWGGYGLFGGSPAYTWINGNHILSTYTVAHELGHNLGLHHSNALECGSTSIGGSCYYKGSGDVIDVMGNPNLAHFNSFQKERLGWLSEAQGNIVEASGSQTYKLEPYAGTLGGNPKAIKVLKSIDEVTGAKSWYYIEYRQPVGFDTSLEDLLNIGNGLVIRTGTDGEENSATSALLDMTPDSGWYSTLDWKDPALETGSSFTDSGAGITISADWVDGNTAQLTVTTEAQPCVPTTPSVSVTPGQSEWVPAGTSVEYLVTVTNNDGSVCSPSNFNLNATTASGWSTAFSASSLSLAPGESASATMAVASSTSATDGFYDIATTASNGHYSATQSVTYVVQNPVATNQSPEALDDGASTEYNTPVTVAVLDNDSDPDGDNLTVTYVSGVNGNATINSDGTVSFTPAEDFSGTETFGYSISDGQGNSASATVTIDVAAAPVTNKAPVAMNDNAMLTDKTPIIIDVLGNDWDPDGDAVSVTAVSTATKGEIQINADGTLTFTPAKNFKDTDTFSYTISDGKQEAVADVTVLLDNSSTGGSTNGNGKGPNK